jgi:hypothetical protein
MLPRPNIDGLQAPSRTGRGHSWRADVSHLKSFAMGHSWALERRTAAWFAQRSSFLANKNSHRGEETVVWRRARRSDLVACFDREREVVLSPSPYAFRRWRRWRRLAAAGS